MKIKYFFQQNKVRSIDQIKINDAIENISLVFGLTNQSEVEIIVTKPIKMKQLNNQYRKINRPTDVLSFPQANFDLNRNLLGSIVLCPEIIDDKKEDIVEVVKHGFLHLLGYDHESNLDKWKEAALAINCSL